MRVVRYTLLTALAAAAPIALRAQQATAPRTIASQTTGMERRDGFIPFYYDERTGKLLLEVQRLDQDFLYLPTLATGLGSDDLGLDRGTTGADAVVQFQRFGPRVLLVSRNTDFRATADSLQAHAVEESFATSILASMPIVAEEGGRLLVDATDFVLQDVMGVSSTIQRQKQGTFRLDRNRSAIYLPRTKAFPKNTEVEVLLTFDERRARARSLATYAGCELADAARALLVRRAARRRLQAARVRSARRQLLAHVHRLLAPFTGSRRCAGFSAGVSRRRIRRPRCPTR